jgi:hypothetical protein
MEAPALLDCLLEIAGETGLPVQRMGRQPAFEGLPLGASGVCRVRGELRVLLFESDPLAERIRCWRGPCARAAAPSSRGGSCRLPCAIAWIARAPQVRRTPERRRA